jgi:hypothetical protein
MGFTAFLRWRWVSEDVIFFASWGDLWEGGCVLALAMVHVWTGGFGGVSWVAWHSVCLKKLIEGGLSTL